MSIMDLANIITKLENIKREAHDIIKRVDKDIYIAKCEIKILRDNHIRVACGKCQKGKITVPYRPLMDIMWEICPDCYGTGYKTIEKYVNHLPYSGE